MKNIKRRLIMWLVPDYYEIKRKNISLEIEIEGLRIYRDKVENYNDKLRKLSYERFPAEPFYMVSPGQHGCGDRILNVMDDYYKEHIERSKILNSKRSAFVKDRINKIEKLLEEI